MNQPYLLFIHELVAFLQPLYHDFDYTQSIAWYIVKEVTQESEASLRVARSIKPDVRHKVLSIIDRHIKEHIPLAYLLGSVQFGDCVLTVKEPYLIPRPETEEWIYGLIALLQKISNKNISILDIGTGTGALAIALSKAFPEAQIVAVDIISGALQLAQENNLKNSTSVTFLRSDLYEALPVDSTFDLIVSNPPYISHEEWLELDVAVKSWEDYGALVAADNGFELIKKIINHASGFLRKNDELLQQLGGQLYIEIGHLQAQQAAQYMKKYFNKVALLKDYAGHDRVVSGGIGNVEAQRILNVDSKE